MKIASLIESKNEFFISPYMISNSSFILLGSIAEQEHPKFQEYYGSLDPVFGVKPKTINNKTIFEKVDDGMFLDKEHDRLSSWVQATLAHPLTVADVYLPVDKDNSVVLEVDRKFYKLSHKLYKYFQSLGTIDKIEFAHEDLFLAVTINQNKNIFVMLNEEDTL